MNGTQERIKTFNEAFAGKARMSPGEKGYDVALLNEAGEVTRTYMNVGRVDVNSVDGGVELEFTWFIGSREG